MIVLQVFDHLGAAVQYREKAGRHARIQQHLGQQHGGERRVRGRLEDDRVAGRERGRDLVRDGVERRVERRDGRHHAQRHAQREAQAAACPGAPASGITSPARRRASSEEGASASGCSGALRRWHRPG